MGSAVSLISSGIKVANGHAPAKEVYFAGFLREIISARGGIGNGPSTLDFFGFQNAEFHFHGSGHGVALKVTTNLAIARQSTSRGEKSGCSRYPSIGVKLVCRINHLKAV